MMCAKCQTVSLPQPHQGVVSTAKLAGASDDRLENGRDVRRRGGDDLEDVGAAGLIGEGLGEIKRLRLHFLEQADIADGNDSLIGKGLQQGDLLVGERVCLEASQRNRSNAFTLAQQWNAKNRAVALLGKRLPSLRELIAFGGEQIVHMHWNPVDDRAPSDPVPINR